MKTNKINKTSPTSRRPLHPTLEREEAFMYQRLVIQLRFTDFLRYRKVDGSILTPLMAIVSLYLRQKTNLEISAQSS